MPNVFSQAPSLESDIWQQDIALNKGEVYLVEAESGKGKSTFCSYIIGYRHDYSGRVMFDSLDSRELKPCQWTRLRQTSLAYLFQELRLFPELTAMENVEIKNNITGFNTRQQIEERFEMLGIADKMDAKVGRMSFGQQQRVAMIRALAQPFDFILADEPISHLDDNNANMMSQLMLGEAQRQGAGVIVTSIGKHLDLEYDKTFRL